MQFYFKQAEGDAATGSDPRLERLVRIKDVVNRIDWLLKNKAVANAECIAQLRQARQLLHQEALMIDYGL